MILSSYSLPISLKKRDFILLLNGLNGHVELLSTSLWNRLQQAVKEKEFSNFPPKLIKTFQKRNLLIASKEKERQLFNRLAKKLEGSVTKSKKLCITINFTEDCNLACSYCFNRFYRKKIQMTLPQLERVLATLEELKQKGYQPDKIIHLCGGEPLMAENFFLLEHLLRKLSKSQYKLFIITNGVTLEKYFDLFSSHRSLIDGFQITLDGPATIHDKRRIGKKYPKTFSLIAHGIDLLLKNNFKVSIRSNINEDNLPFLPELATFIVKKGWSAKKNCRPYLSLIFNNQVKYCKNNPVSQTGNFIRQFRKLSKENHQLAIYKEEDFYSEPQRFLSNVLKRKRNYPSIGLCMSAGGQSLTFAADGKMYACIVSGGIEAFCLGRYFPKLAWDKNLSLWKNRLSTKIPKCRKCPLVFVCSGNCSFEAYEQNGNINFPACHRAIENLQEFVDLNQDKIFKFVKTSTAQPLTKQPEA